MQPLYICDTYRLGSLCSFKVQVVPSSKTHAFQVQSKQWLILIITTHPQIIFARATQVDRRVTRAKNYDDTELESMWYEQLLR
jgi:hypothetical protein